MVIDSFRKAFFIFRAFAKYVQQIKYFATTLVVPYSCTGKKYPIWYLDRFPQHVFPRTRYQNYWMNKRIHRLFPIIGVPLEIFPFSRQYGAWAILSVVSWKYICNGDLLSGLYEIKIRFGKYWISNFGNNEKIFIAKQSKIEPN